jgi:uncharacterized protein
MGKRSRSGRFPVLGHGRGHKQRKRRRWRDNCDCDCTPDCDCSPFMVVTALLRVLALRAPGRPPSPRPSTPGRVGMAAIRGYQRWMSPRLPTRCRHRPTCSSYGLEAVRRYGLVVGSRLIAGRLRRCNSGVPHGTQDPVP